MTDDIAAIRAALAAGPTPGPWLAVDVREMGELQQFGIICERDPLGTKAMDIAAVWKRGGPKKSEANARLIAACSPDRIARLLDALEQAQKNAERYRWLRAMDITHEWGVVNGDMSEAPVLEELDAAIDAAMQGDSNG